MKKLLKILAVIVVVALVGIYATQFIHKCDDCGKIFLGTGYDPNILSELINEEELTICRECAETHHGFSIALGKSLDDYKKNIQWDPIKIIENWIKEKNSTE